jgi:hypothetical protein
MSGQPVDLRDIAHCEPESEDGCFIRVPDDFTGMPHTYVTEVSVPRFGDGGVQRLHAPMKEPEPGLEPEAGA